MKKTIITLMAMILIMSSMSSALISNNPSDFLLFDNGTIDRFGNPTNQDEQISTHGWTSFGGNFRYFDISGSDRRAIYMNSGGSAGDMADWNTTEDTFGYTFTISNQNGSSGTNFINIGDTIELSGTNIFYILSSSTLTSVCNGGGFSFGVLNISGEYTRSTDDLYECINGTCSNCQLNGGVDKGFYLDTLFLFHDVGGDYWIQDIFIYNLTAAIPATPSFEFQVNLTSPQNNTKFSSDSTLSINFGFSSNQDNSCNITLNSSNFGTDSLSQGIDNITKLLSINNTYLIGFGCNNGSDTVFSNIQVQINITGGAVAETEVSIADQIAESSSGFLSVAITLVILAGAVLLIKSKLKR